MKANESNSNPTSQKINFSNLPSEILFHCFSYLQSPTDLVSLTKTSHTIRNIAFDCRLWQKYDRVFFSEYPKLLTYKKYLITTSLKFTSLESKHIVVILTNSIEILDPTNFDTLKEVEVTDNSTCNALITIPGNRFAYTKSNGKIHIWQANVVQKSTFRVFKHHSFKINKLCQERIIECCSIPDKCPAGGIQALAYLGNGYIVSGGCCKPAITIWDLTTGKLVKELTGHDNKVTCMAVLPNGKLATASNKNKDNIHIWDIQSGKCIKKLKVGIKPHDIHGYVHALCALANGSLACARDDITRIWDIKKNKCVNLHGVTFTNIHVEYLSLLQSSHLACYSPGRAFIWICNTTTGTTCMTIKVSPTRYTFSRVSDFTALNDGRIAYYYDGAFVIYEFKFMLENRLDPISNIDKEVTTDKCLQM